MTDKAFAACQCEGLFRADMAKVVTHTSPWKTEIPQLQLVEPWHVKGRLTDQEPWPPGTIVRIGTEDEEADQLDRKRDAIQVQQT